MEYWNTAELKAAGDIAGAGGSKGRDAAAAAAAGGKTAGVKSSGADPRERHKLAERERRKSMRELFLSLHSLLPHADAVRKEQSTILDEIIKYIPMAVARRRSLESRRRLQLSALSNKPASPSPSSSVVVPKYSSSSEGCNGGDGADPSGGGAAASPSSSKLKRTRSARSDGGGLRESLDFDIRIAPELTSWVSIRVRGDRVNVSLADDAKGGAASSQSTILLSAIFDDLEAHGLDLVRSTHYRDGSKLVHHSESQIRDDATQSPEVFKASMQDLALKLYGMRRPPAQAAPRKPRCRLTSQGGVWITSAGDRRRELPPGPTTGEQRLTSPSK